MFSVKRERDSWNVRSVVMDRAFGYFFPLPPKVKAVIALGALPLPSTLFTMEGFLLLHGKGAMPLSGLKI